MIPPSAEAVIRRPQWHSPGRPPRPPYLQQPCTSHWHPAIPASTATRAQRIRYPRAIEPSPDGASAPRSLNAVSTAYSSAMAASTAAMLVVLTIGHTAGSRAAATEDSGPGTLQEVIVTANKQAEPLQKTPAAITAIGGELLIYSGVTDIRGAEDLVPSVRFQQENAATEIYVRGVGSTLDFPQVAAPNVFNLDGISVPREATSVPLYDIDQLEVLPGPQGTLYGSSALGGAVNVNFRRPTMEYETNTLLEIGDYSMYHVGAAENLPITSNLAMRAAVDYLSHTGYQISGADSQKDLGGRLSVIYRPNENVTAYLWGSSVSKEGHPPNLVPKGINSTTGKLDPNSYLTSNPWNDQFPAPYAGSLPYGQPRAELQSYFNKMTGGQIDIKMARDTTLTWIPSYLSVATSPDYWLGAFPGNESDNYRQITNELRASASNPWGTWIAGLYAYDLDSNGTFTFGSFTPGTGVPVSIVDFNRIEGEALFGQVTFNLGPGLRWTLGGRYSIDDRVGRGQFLEGTALEPFTYGENFSHADYKVGIAYDVAAHVMLYSETQTGYQPGTFNAFASTPSVSNAVNEATLTAYTVGAKSRLFDDRLQMDDELFYYDYRGLFASAYNTVLNSNQTFNAQKTEIYGDQLDILFRLTTSDQLNLSIGYLSARNIRFELPDRTQNFDGFQLQYAPDWTINAGYFHDFRWATGYLRAKASSRFEDSFYADFSHTPGGRQQPYVKSDASLTYYSSIGGWSFGAWIKNIENVAVIAATAGGSNIPPLATGATAFLEPPRTYGLRATWNF
jgi:iron complex outermembrane receptor protein